GLVGHDVAERHLVEPALASVRAEDPPVRAGLLEELDLVALVELADLNGTELIGGVEEGDDAISDETPLITDPGAVRVVEAEARGDRHGPGRVVLAGLL